MEAVLNLTGIFESEAELRRVVAGRRMCYDVEPYYRPDHKGGLIQIGFQISLYGTFSGEDADAGPDAGGYAATLRDVRRVAEALTNTCGPLHMCGASVLDAGMVTYSPERGMRPDVTVHVPVFDHQQFGHPVDDTVRQTLAISLKLLEGAGLRQGRWHD